MKVAVLCGMTFALGVGAAMAMEPMMMGPSECGPLRTASQLLTLDEQQMMKAAELRQQYEEDFRDGIEKLRVKLDEDYTVKTSDILDEKQKNNLKMLLAAEQTYSDTVAVANDTYRKQLVELLSVPKDAGEGAEVAGGFAPERFLRMLPEDEKTLFQRYATLDPTLREKHTPVRTRQATASAGVHREASKVDWTNKESRDNWQKDKERRLKEIDDQYMKEALDLLDEKQAETFAKAVEAMLKWQQNCEEAKKTFTDSALAITGPGKTREVEVYLRGLAHRARY